MSENEYEAFNIEEIMQMISEDSVESMADQAQGWSNAAEILRIEYDNVKGQYDTVLTQWTSGSVEPFREQVNAVLTAIHEAEEHARLKASAWSNIAGHAKQFYTNVKDKHAEWEQAKQQGFNGPNVGSIPEFLSEFDANASKDENLEMLHRLEYDKAARNYMNLLAQYAEDEAIALRTPLPQYVPPAAPVDPGEYPPGTDATVNATTYGSAASTSMAGPTLQSTVPGVATPSLPVGAVPPTGGVPGGYTPTMPGGAPIGGVSPVGRTPTPPALRPPSAGGPGARPTVPPPRTGGAPRTPSLPTNRPPVTGRPGGGIPGQRGGGMPGRPGTAGRPGGSPARGGVPGQGGRGATPTRGGAPSKGATNNRGNSGRTGLQKSQMAPVDRRGSVRSSGQVLGQRPTASQPNKNANSGKSANPSARRVQPSVIGRRAGMASNGKLGGITRKKPADQTSKGYTRSVLGGKKRVKKDKDDKFSRTPIIASTVTAAGMVIGARVVPSAEDERMRRLNARRARREKLRSGGDQPTRAIIGNGVQRPDELAEAKPTGDQPVKAKESPWEIAPVLPTIIGQRQARPEVDHDPGPTPLSQVPVEQPTDRSHSAGPVAFKDRSTRSGNDWLQ